MPLNIHQKELLLALVEAERTRDPARARELHDIANEIALEIDRHGRAAALAQKRNAAKHSRRTQRGPNI